MWGGRKERVINAGGGGEDGEGGGGGGGRGFKLCFQVIVLFISRAPVSRHNSRFAISKKAHINSPWYKEPANASFISPIIGDGEMASAE